MALQGKGRDFGKLYIFKVISMKCKLKKTYAVWYWCPAATDKSFLDQQKMRIPVFVLTGIQSLLARVTARSFCKSEECEQLKSMTYTLELYTLFVELLRSGNCCLQMHIYSSNIQSSCVNWSEPYKSYNVASVGFGRLQPFSEFPVWSRCIDRVIKLFAYKNICFKQI